MIGHALVVTALAMSVTTTTSWEVAELPAGSANVVASTALSANDVWTAGFTITQTTGGGHNVVGFEPEARHWNGQAWSTVPTPPIAMGRLNAISASARDQIWAVGDEWGQNASIHSLVERWDGRSWTQIPADDLPDVTQSLYGVAATSRTDAWAVGSADDSEHTFPVAQHWDGARWRQVAVPVDNGALYAVAASGPSDVWAAGVVSEDDQPERPLVMHWNGVAWTRIALPSTADRGQARLSAITVSHGQVWATGNSTVGGALNRTPLAFHIDRRGATIEPTPDEPGQLNGVTTRGREVWAVGYQYDEEGMPHAYVLRRSSDGVWLRATAPETVNGTLYSVTTVPGRRTLWTTGAMAGAEPGLPAPLIARTS